MKTTPFFARLLTQSGDPFVQAEAVTLARDLHGQPGLCYWLVHNVAVSPVGRTAALVRAAQVSRDELADFRTGSLLDRMADSPALFNAIITELRKSSADDCAPKAMPA